MSTFWLAALGLAVMVVVGGGNDPVTHLLQRFALGRRLTYSALDSDGVVRVPPDELVADCVLTAGGPVSLDEYSLARMVASENGVTGSAFDGVCRVLVALNDAAALGWSPARLITYSTVSSRNGFFGRQVSRRYASTVDPHQGHLDIVRAAAAARSSGNDYTRGATKFADVGAFGAQSGTRSWESVSADWRAAGYELYSVNGTSRGLVFGRKGAS